jgi:putative RNA 2'-phosphotransferase
MNKLIRSRDERLTRWLMRVLRHTNAEDGIRIDCEGWTRIDELLNAIPVDICGWIPFARVELLELIWSKLADRIEQKGEMVRARYGHSIASVDVGLLAVPPPHLFHATSRDFLSRVFFEGLQPGRRTRVHLTENPNYANQLATSIPQGVILLVDTQEAMWAGTAFYATSTHVWLATEVPVTAITLLESLLP